MDNSNYVSVYTNDQFIAQTVNRFIIVSVAALTGPEHKMGTFYSHSACLS